jgi:uncharacterized protein YjbJ (UPF0337 family)
MTDDSGETDMNWQTIKGNWKRFKGEVQRRWGELTDDDLDRIEGDREILVGRLQELYGKGREAVESEVDAWFETLEEKAKTRG